MISSNVVLDPDRLAREVEFFGNQGEFVYDVETLPSSEHADDRGVPSHNQVTWLGMATHGRTIQIPMGHKIGTRVVGETTEIRYDRYGQLRKSKSGKTMQFKIPVYEPAPEQMSRADVFALINPLFADASIIKGAHGATFDNASVAKYRPDAAGLPQIPAGTLPCTIVMRWLTDENRMRYGLKYITKDVYGFAYDDEEVGRTVEKFPFNMVGHYLHCDVKYTWLEYLRNKQVIEYEGLQELYEMETQLVSVLAQMRLTGIKIDAERLEGLRDDLDVRVQESERKVWSAAGEQFNVNAVAQKQARLYKPKSEGGQGLLPFKLTDGGKKKVALGQVPDHTFYSTDDEALSTFVGNLLVDALLEYQETSKVLSTYVTGYLGDPDDREKPSRIFDGKIYADFVQYAAATGRFGCRAPNLQNVPAPRTDLGKLVRGLFVAEPGWKLVVSDYGQVELVILADLAYKLTGVKGALWHGFHEGIDPHTMTAAMVLGKDPKDVTKNERQRFGKSLNFAVVYGAGGTKVANMAEMEVTDSDYRKGKSRAAARLRKRYEKQGLPEDEIARKSADEGEIRAWLLWEKGQDLLNTYNERFPEVAQAKAITLRDAKNEYWARVREAEAELGRRLTWDEKKSVAPYTTTLLGRRRRLIDLVSGADDKRAYAERQLFNARVQGSSADMTKMAMIIFMRDKKPHWKLLLTVHDELVASAPAAEAEECKAVLMEAMAGAYMQEFLSVPLTADPVIVDRWDEAKD